MFCAIKKPLCLQNSITINLNSDDITPDGYVIKLEIVDIQKRKDPQKHYTYVLNGTWSNGKVITINRRFSMFFDFQLQLESTITQMQLNEILGNKVEKNLIIPSLPGKIFIGRSHTRYVADKRRSKIEEFCKQLLELPTEISRSDIVLRFFSLWPEDIPQLSMIQSNMDSTLNQDSTIDDEPDVEEKFITVADYMPTHRHQLSVRAGIEVVVLEKRLSGWWLCMHGNTQGYLPAALLQPQNGTTAQNERVEEFECRIYIVNADYKAASPDELNLKRGQKVEILFKSYDGWWRIKLGEEVGIVPSLFLTELQHFKRRETFRKKSTKGLYEHTASKFNPPPRRDSINRDPKKIQSTYTVLDELTDSYLLQEETSGNVDLQEIFNLAMDVVVTPQIAENYSFRDDVITKPNPPSNGLFKASSIQPSELSKSESTPLFNKNLLHNINNRNPPPKPLRSFANIPVNSPPPSFTRSPSYPELKNIYQNYPTVNEVGNNPTTKKPIRSRPLLNHNSLKIQHDPCFADIRRMSKDDNDVNYYMNTKPLLHPVDVYEINSDRNKLSPFRSPRSKTQRDANSPLLKYTGSEKVLINMYIALDNYEAQNETCLPFHSGDKGLLLQSSDDNQWWFMRVNEAEGWTPSSFWDIQTLQSDITAPPTIIPKKPNCKNSSSSNINNKTKLKKITSEPARNNNSPKPLISEKPNLSPIPTTIGTNQPNNKFMPPIILPNSVKISNTTTVTSNKNSNNNDSNSEISQDLNDLFQASDISNKYEDTLPTTLQQSKHSSDMTNESFLWGKMTRKECESLLLRRAKQGEFIFRESQNREGELILSMRYYYKIHHFNIKQDKEFFCIGDKFRVTSLMDIVKHFQKNPIASYKETEDKMIDVFLSNPLPKTV